MAEEPLESPPYPEMIATSVSLFRSLRQLSDWAEGQQEVLKEIVPPKVAARLKPIAPLPRESVWENVSINDKHTTLTLMRRVREKWDQVLRDHEDSWDSKLARQRRFSVVSFAMYVLREACVAPEVREMRTMQAQEQYLAHVKAIEAHMNKVLLPPEMQEQVQAADAENEEPGQDEWDEELEDDEEDETQE